MKNRPMPWRNVEVKYCPRCRVAYPLDAVKCEKCGKDLVVQTRREKLDDR